MCSFILYFFFFNSKEKDCLASRFFVRRTSPRSFFQTEKRIRSLRYIPDLLGDWNRQKAKIERNAKKRKEARSNYANNQKQNFPFWAFLSAHIQIHSLALSIQNNIVWASFKNDANLLKDFLNISFLLRSQHYYLEAS